MAAKTIQFDQASVRQFNRNVDEMAAMTKAAFPKVMRNMGRDFCRMAMKNTPQAKGRVRGKGFAKSGWIKPMRGLGMVVKSKAGDRGGKKGPEMGDYKSRKSLLSASIEVANQVPYIEELDRGSSQNGAFHIMQKSIDATNAKTKKTLGRLADRRKQKWR